MVRRHRHLLLMTDTSPLPTSYKHEFLLHKCQRGCSVSIQGSCLFALHALHAALALETFSGQFWPRPRLSSLLGMARRRRGGGGGGLAGLAIGLLGKLFGCVAAQVEVAKADDTDAIKSKNDYELVVRASKELEHVLEASLGAQGKGLHEKATSVQRLLSKDLVRKIRYLATIRNKLVHEYRFNSIPDRSTFIRNFVSAKAEMQAVVARHGRHSPGQQPDDICKIM